MEKKPLCIISGGAVYDVQVREHQRTPRTELNRELAHVRRGLARSSGVLQGVDLVTLKQELREAREQGAERRLA